MKIYDILFVKQYFDILNVVPLSIDTLPEKHCIASKRLNQTRKRRKNLVDISLFSSIESAILARNLLMPLPVCLSMKQRKICLILQLSDMLKVECIIHVVVGCRFVSRQWTFSFSCRSWYYTHLPSCTIQFIPCGRKSISFSAVQQCTF